MRYLLSCLFLCVGIILFSSFESPDPKDLFEFEELQLDTIPSDTSILSPTKESEERIFKVVEEMPRFPGCEGIETIKEKRKCSEKKMLTYIYSNLVYPKNARLNKIEGMVIIKFIVDKQGHITNSEIAMDIGEGCGEAALNVVNSMNEMNEKWIPGKMRGEPVAVQYSLPVRFKLR